MSPRADFVCNAAKCRQDDGAPVYELPVSATRCPVCGSKRIVRLFNKVNIATGARPDHFDGRRTSSSHAARTEALAGSAVESALAKRNEVYEKARLYPMVNAVPMRQLGGALNQVYAGNGAAGVPAVDQSALTKKADLGGSLPSAVQDLQNARMPREIVARDTEYKLVKGDGGPRIEKA